MTLYPLFIPCQVSALLASRRLVYFLSVSLLTYHVCTEVTGSLQAYVAIRKLHCISLLPRESNMICIGTHTFGKL